jgi:hypothetical protein
MRLRLYALLAGASLLVLAAPGAAVAKPGCHHTVTPHGNSEAEQYSETVPGPCGNQPANPGTPSTGGSGGSSSSSIPPGTLNQLQSHGAAGQNAAALAEAGAPSGGSAQGSNGTGSNGGGAGGGNQSSGGGAVSGVSDALGGDSGGSGIGLLLPLILAGTLVAGIAYWLMRRRAGPVS